jgi:hypothetical protein
MLVYGRQKGSGESKSDSGIMVDLNAHGGATIGVVRHRDTGKGAEHAANSR